MRRSIGIGGMVMLAAVAGCTQPEPTCKAPGKLTGYFPSDNEIGSWHENTAVHEAGIALADADTAREQNITVKKAVEDIVDGDADAFTARGMMAFARQDYVDSGNNNLELRIWQMPDADKATEVYEWTQVNDVHYNGSTWTEVAVGEAGRETVTAGYRWVNARQCHCQVEARIDPDNAANQTAVIDFLKQVLAKLPHKN
ncbi:MAG: hypothetical protein JXR83_17420 [Deltaproteobacteria bacterium]|nr:hypothetical protein [Deltaproteobacteria bacterium]